MATKKVMKRVETVGPNGCVDFRPQVKHLEQLYDCVNGTWVLKTGSPRGACNPKSKFASDKWNYSYICNPPTGRYRHIAGTPAAPRKARKAGVGKGKGKGVKRGPSAFNVFFSTVMKRPKFQAMADRKAKFAAAMQEAKVEWKKVNPEQKAEYSAIAKEAAAIKAARETKKVKTDF
jgi:hypothetical protein